MIKLANKEIEITREKIFTWIIFIYILGIFILLLLPIINGSFYAFPAEDDYGAAADLFHMIQGEASVKDIILYLLSTTINMWKSWQGSYFSLFTGILISGVEGYKYYYIGTFIVLGMYIWGNLYFMKTVFVDACKTNVFNAWSVSCLIMTLQLNLMPSIAEGLYWHSGSIRYVLFHGVELLYLGLLIQIVFTENKKKANALTWIAIGFSFMVGGINLLASLQSVILITSLTILCIIKKNVNSKNILFNNIVLICFFMVSAISPGNANRSHGADERYSAIEAICKSFVKSFEYGVKWINVFLVLFLILATIIFSKVAKKMEYEFKHPVLVILFAYCVYAATYTPTIYGLGNYLPARVLNITYFNFIFFVFISVLYLTGWIVKHNNKKIPRILVSGITAITMILLLGCIRGDSGMVLWGKEALQEYREGILQQFKIEQEERIQLYLDKENQNVVVEPLTVQPKILFIDDIRGDKEYWTNQGLAMFWEKDSIVVKK